MKLKKLLENIFSVKNEYKNNKGFKIVRIFGLKIKKKIFDNNLPYIPARRSYLYPNMDWYEHSFKDFIDSPKLTEAYCNLIENLDEDSIETVSKIIHRYQVFKKTGESNFFLSQAEIDEIKNFNNFKQQIVQLDENLYAYKHYLLPCSTPDRFEYGVFCKDYYINAFSNHNIDKSILDVGAYIGDSALVLSKYTNQKVYAFEPFEGTYNKLLQTLQINNVANIVPVNCGLMDEVKSDAKIYGGGSGIANSLTRIHGDVVSNVETTTLDEWIKKNPVDVGLIKVDIESSEQKFLKGAINTIKEQRPNMIICIYHGASDFFNIKTMIEGWNLGYKFKILKMNPCEISNETILLCSIEDFNYSDNKK